MNYDLRDKSERRRYVRYTNMLLREQRSNVRVVDESSRTPNQNNYIHILFRILAADIGVTEQYAKQVYFKQKANSDIFLSVTKDPLTGELTPTIRSTKDLTIPEMRRAITRFREWAAENGYDLPEARVEDDGTVTFASQKDADAFHQAEIETSKLEEYL